MNELILGMIDCDFCWPTGHYHSRFDSAPKSKDRMSLHCGCLMSQPVNGGSDASQIIVGSRQFMPGECASAVDQ
jgi:hypothetical protein